MPGKTKRSKSVDWNMVARLFLRAIPVLPGPEIYDLVKELQQSRTELGQKAKCAASALEDASSLVTELEGELRTKVEQVAKLKNEYERYQQLASIEEEKAKPFLDQLQRSLGEGRSRERWIALALNLAAGCIVFVLGVLLSPWIKSLVGLGDP